jgi:hypothetical protein
MRRGRIGLCSNVTSANVVVAALARDLPTRAVARSRPRRLDRRPESTKPAATLVQSQHGATASGSGHSPAPRASQPLRAEPDVDPFGDASPPRLQHHVMTHAGEEFCFGAIRARRRKDLLSGMGAVIVGA